ncbi:hypothetical protein HK405_010849 [Cladochytrium tenue]|nr:hypothetical protein HK405_010849 [Cladochytrium tenue]
MEEDLETWQWKIGIFFKFYGFVCKLARRRSVVYMRELCNALSVPSTGTSISREASCNISVSNKAAFSLWVASAVAMATLMRYLRDTGAWFHKLPLNNVVHILQGLTCLLSVEELPLIGLENLPRTPALSPRISPFTIFSFVSISSSPAGRTTTTPGRVHVPDSGRNEKRVRSSDALGEPLVGENHASATTAAAIEEMFLFIEAQSTFAKQRGMFRHLFERLRSSGAPENGVPSAAADRTSGSSGGRQRRHDSRTLVGMDGVARADGTGDEEPPSAADPTQAGHAQIMNGGDLLALFELLAESRAAAGQLAAVLRGDLPQPPPHARLRDTLQAVAKEQVAATVETADGFGARDDDAGFGRHGCVEGDDDSMFLEWLLSL